MSLKITFIFAAAERVVSFLQSGQRLSTTNINVAVSAPEAEINLKVSGDGVKTVNPGPEHPALMYTLEHLEKLENLFMSRFRTYREGIDFIDALYQMKCMIKVPEFWLACETREKFQNYKKRVGHNIFMHTKRMSSPDWQQNEEWSLERLNGPRRYQDKIMEEGYYKRAHARRMEPVFAELKRVGIKAAVDSPKQAPMRYTVEYLDELEQLVMSRFKTYSRGIDFIDALYQMKCMIKVPEFWLAHGTVEEFQNYKKHVGENIFMHTQRMRSHDLQRDKEWSLERLNGPKRYLDEIMEDSFRRMHARRFASTLIEVQKHQIKVG